jgi:cobalt/nickel transport system permease protein
VVVLPFVATGERVHPLGIPLAVDGLWLAWGIVAKASLVLLATAVVAACTPPAAILAGAERLHAPRILTAIAGFTIRYVEVVLAELGRMQTARVARGDDPRFFWQAKAVIRSAGTLLVRCFERGERVQLAMVSRGWDGGIPAGLLTAPAKPVEWAGALSVPVLAVLTVVAARVIGA